jgi:hypothetical protein
LANLILKLIPFRRSGSVNDQWGVAIIADYPLQTPLILRITLNAESISREAYECDHSVPQATYRHVLWSYLLTREFGAELAEIITNAHEERHCEDSAKQQLDFIKPDRAGICRQACKTRSDWGIVESGLRSPTSLATRQQTKEHPSPVQPITWGSIIEVVISRQPGG